MKYPLPCLVLLALFSASGAFAGLLYDNTTTDTLDTLVYSAGPYTGIGDQIHLVAAGNAVSALLQMFNAGGAGTFDAQLRFYQVGAPVGGQTGGTFTLSGVASTGGDVINLQFALGGLALPQDVIFVASVNQATGMDLGLNLFEPPAVGSSDNTFLIVDNAGFSQAISTNENVYFQLSDSTAPEPSTFSLLAAGLAAAALWRKVGRTPGRTPAISGIPRNPARSGARRRVRSHSNAHAAARPRLPKSGGIDVTEGWFHLTGAPLP